jgi:hypothetical protein
MTATATPTREEPEMSITHVHPRRDGHFVLRRPSTLVPPAPRARWRARWTGRVRIRPTDTHPGAEPVDGYRAPPPLAQQRVWADPAPLDLALVMLRSR